MNKNENNPATLQPIPSVTTGTIVRLANFKSAYVSPRHIDIWLPENYHADTHYAVLYMHDGQMLFDKTITWNKQSWNVAETLDNLITSNTVRDCIVVGIWNGDASRHSDYFPQKPFEALPSDYQNALLKQDRSDNETVLFSNGVQSDNYLKFIVEELKPYIDDRFATLPDMENTFIAGSSMGALISIYALCEYPTVFGGAACLSPHWVGTFTNENNPIPNAFVNYLKHHLPNPKRHLNHHHIYFDYGTETLDALYKVHQLKVDEVMKDKGYTSENWQTHKFVGEDHSENAWKKRLHIPLKFLLSKE